MSDYSGYMGKVALLDLGSQELKNYPWSDEDRLQCLGGKAMAAKLISDCLKDNVDALSEQNPIVITTGPLTGTGAVCSSHFVLASRSPVTGGVTFAECGGDFGLYLKKAGFDALIVTGKCDKPSWVELRNDKLFIRKAGSVWGMETSPAQNALQEAVNSSRNCRVKCGMLAIGPAGENLSKLATVICGAREAVGCDLGAVFGAKKLKAIVVEGNKDIEVHDADKLKALNKSMTASLKAHPLTGELLPKMGTLGFVSFLNKKGLAPFKNYSDGKFGSVDKISGETFADTYNACARGCTYCPVKCERTVSFNGELIKGPELDAMILLGSNIDNADPELIIKWNHKLHELGLDLALTANTIAWAMNANEKGLFDSELVFGRTNNIPETLVSIAKCEGKGAELSEGAEALTAKFGGEEFYYNAKGLELLAAAQYLGLKIGKGGDYAKPAVKGIAASIEESILCAGVCKLYGLSYIPEVLVTAPDSMGARALRAFMPIAIKLFTLCDGVSIVKALDYACGMQLKFAQFVNVGAMSIAEQAALNEKLGAKSAPFLSKQVAACHKAATAFSVKDELERAKGLCDKLVSKFKKTEEEED